MAQASSFLTSSKDNVVQNWGLTKFSYFGRLIVETVCLPKDGDLTSRILKAQSFCSFFSVTLKLKTNIPVWYVHLLRWNISMKIQDLGLN